MSLTKHSVPKRPTSKHARTNSDNFKSIETDLKYNDCYKRVTIIMERVVKLDTLKDSFISEVFKERTWTKLLNLVGVVYLESVQGKDVDKAAKSDWSCILGDHKGIFLKC